MISFFRDKSAVSVFWLIIVCFGIHIYSLIHAPQLTILASDGFFYYLLLPLKSAPSFTLSACYVIFVFLLALQLNFVMNALHMLPKQGYTPALAFILLSALLPQFQQISSALLACNLVIWMLYSCVHLYNTPKAKTKIYNLGFLVGISVILYYPLLPFILISFFGLTIMRVFRLNESFMLLLGILTPLYFLAGYLFLKGDLKLLPQPQQLFSIYFSNTLPLHIIIITFSVVTLLIFLGIASVKKGASRELIQVRKSWPLILISLLFTIPCIFLMPAAWPLAILLPMVPASFYIGFYFSINQRNIIPVLFFWALIALIIYNNWFAKY